MGKIIIEFDEDTRDLTINLDNVNVRDISRAVVLLLGQALVNDKAFIHGLESKANLSSCNGEYELENAKVGDDSPPHNQSSTGKAN